MTRFLLFLALCLALVGCPKGGDPSPSPDTVTSGPSDEMMLNVAVLEPIADKELSDFFTQFAVMVENDADSKIMTSTGHLRSVLADGGVFRFHSEKKGMYPTLGDDITTVLDTVLTRKNGPFDRSVAVDMLKAIGMALK